MTGTEGISSLQTALGSFNVTETRQAGSVKTKDSSDAAVRTGAGTGNSASQVNPRDHASLSSGTLVSALGATDSDVRTDKVAALQQAIANGTYNVPASDVADRIVESLLG